MTENDLKELHFTKIIVPVEESGDEFAYHYYIYPLNDSINLVSSTSDESNQKNWKVSVDYWGEIDNVESVSELISFFKNIKK